MSKKRFAAVMTVLLVFALVNTQLPDHGQSVYAVSAANKSPSVKIVNKVKKVSSIKNSRLGSATFKIDNKSSVSVEYPANGKAVTLSLTDKSGLTWTLIIPGDALGEKRKITMTAMTDVKSSSLPCKITGGVVLAPDGLRFLNPAILTVTAKKAAKKSVEFTGNSKGSALEFAAGTEGKNTSALIYHFSTAYYSDDPKIQGLTDIALKDYNDAVAAAKSLLKQPLVMLAPPSFDFKCKKEADFIAADESQAAKDFEDSVRNPEQDVIQRLITTKKVLYTLGRTSSNLDDSIIEKLVNRQLDKVKELIKIYKPQHDKLYRVSRIALQIWKQSGILTKSEYTGLDVLADWTIKARDYYKSEMSDKSDYKALSAFLYLTAWAERLGAAVDIDKDYEEIAKALSFDLYFDAVITQKSESFDGEWKISGKVPVYYMLDETPPAVGTGYYDSVRCKEYGYWTGQQWSALDLPFVSPSNFKLDSMIADFKPCDGTVDIGIQRFTASYEYYMWNTTYGGESTDSRPNDIVADLFGKYMVSDENERASGMYVFELPLTNMSGTAAEKTFTETGVSDDGANNENSITCHLKLVHTPTDKVNLTPYLD